MYETSNFYYRFPSELENRLDFVFYHPFLDPLIDLETYSNFDVVQISSIIRTPEDLVSGKTPRGIPYIEDGIPFLGGTNIRTNETDLSDPVRIPETYHTTKLVASQLSRSDVLITIAGVGIGTCSVYESDDQANINQAVARLRFDQESINPQYLTRFLNSTFGQMGFTKFSHWVLQPNINLEEIKLLRILKPTKTKQNEILEKIKPFETEYKTLKHETSRLQSDAFNYLLNELGFNNIGEYNYFFKSGAEGRSLSFLVFPDEIEDRLNYLHYHPELNILERLKKDYQTVTLESICERKILSGVQPEFVENGERMVLKTIDLKNRYIDYNNALRVSEKFYSSNLINEVKKNDIIIAATGYVSMGKIDVYDNEEPALISGELLSCRVNKNYDPYFVAYYLRSHFGQIQIEKFWTGSSGQIHLHDKDVNKFILPSHESIPNNIQTKIAQKIRKKIEKALSLEQLAYEKLLKAKSLFEELIAE